VQLAAERSHPENDPFDEHIDRAVCSRQSLRDLVTKAPWIVDPPSLDSGGVGENIQDGDDLGI
jgi:hypothetical protein